MKIERRTMEEQVGVSLNASSLRIESSHPGGETSLQRVAALGAAVLHVRHGADRMGPGGRSEPVVFAAGNPVRQVTAHDHVSGELASELYHLRYGGQYERLGRAVELLVVYIGTRQRFGAAGFLSDMTSADREALIRRFATRALHEWLSDRCVACGGCGRLERAESGSWIRPRGLMKRNAVYRACMTCQGSGRAVPSHTARRKVLGIALAQYERQSWGQHFRAASTWLSVSITKRIRRPLTSQLERSKKRD